LSLRLTWENYKQVLIAISNTLWWLSKSELMGGSFRFDTIFFLVRKFLK